MLLLSQFARALRWRWLLRPVTHVRLLDALWINAATQLANYLVPVRAGEAVRLLWLTRRRAVPGGTSLGCLVVDHAFDLCGVILVLGAGALVRFYGIDPHLPPLPALFVPLGGALMMLIAIAVAALFGPAVARCRIFPCRFRAGLVRHSAAFRTGAGAIVGGRRLSAMVLVSAAAVILDGLAFFMLFTALGLAVPILSAVVAQVVLLYAYLIPSAPGFVGTLEAAGTVLLSAGMGIPGGSAAGAMVLWHGFGAFVIFGMGAIAFHQLRRSGQLAFRLLPHS
jgi:uncharacterized membrane protein YbhN (UPF0104 family)